MKLGTLFTGGGGFDMGAMEAGLSPVWGVEYIPEIAEHANSQLGGHIICADILTLDPADFEPVDWLHASPPCPSFSVANSNKGETEQDVALGEAVARFIRVLRPRYFSMENVYGYRKSKSWDIILKELESSGYGVRMEHINSADFGVPQKRRRMIVRAERDTFYPPAPMRSTHAKGGAGGMLHWVGWYAAIEDIFHTFPISKQGGKYKNNPCSHDPEGLPCRDEICRGHLAPWQEKRLAKEYNERVLFDPDNSSNGLVSRKETEPSNTLRGNQQGSYRAVLVEGSTAGERSPRIFEKDEPAEVVRTGSGSRTGKVLAGSRIVALTPRALARFQTFPDWYELPEKKTLAVTIIGNAVPCLLAQRIVESMTK